MQKIPPPKVVFRLNSPEADAQKLFENCFPQPTGWDWSEYTYRKHPELKTMLRGITSKKKFYDTCLAYTTLYFNTHRTERRAAISTYQHDWSKCGERFLKELAKHFETSWPKSPKTITIYLTISPTCPRFLETWSFWTMADAKPERARRTIYHEILHFLWFKKWQEVFPDADPKEFESPYLPWKISEIMDPIILNHHPKIKNMGQLYDKGYMEFQKAKLGRLKLIPYFERVYTKHLASKESFEAFLKKIWNVTLKYRADIERI